MSDGVVSHENVRSFCEVVVDKHVLLTVPSGFVIANEFHGFSQVRQKLGVSVGWCPCWFAHEVGGYSEGCPIDEFSWGSLQVVLI